MPRHSVVSPAYICQTCGRSFSRAEHRDRHLDTHKLSRPFRCNYCHQEFGRTDSLRRHVDKYCSKNLESPISSNRARSRVRAACDACHGKKLKCNGEQPCHKCMLKTQDCTYNRPGVSRQRLTPEPDFSRTPSSYALRGTEGQPPEFSNKGSEVLVNHSAEPRHEKEALEAPPTSAGSTGLAREMNHETICDLSVPFRSSTDIGSLYDPIPCLDFSDLVWMNSSVLPDFGDEDFTFDDLMLATPEQLDPDEADLSRLASLVDLPVPGSQFDEQTSRWLKLPLIPRKYDIEMLNDLLKVFMTHLPRTFVSFRGFEITANTLPEQVLAMAAVGSLFVDSKGSSRVARMLWTDCHRILNNFVVRLSVYSQDTAISLIQAFIASEIFGICGGHPRSRELSEAYHGTLIQALHAHGLGRTSAGGDGTTIQERLLRDMFMLEAYRAAILQLKPILTPASLACNQGDPQAASSPEYHQRQAHLLTQAQRREPMHDLTIQDLSLLAINSWLASGQWSECSYEAINRSWDPSIMHNSFEAMIQCPSLRDDVSALLLGHMIIVSLHAPLTEINNAASSVTLQGKAPAAAVRRMRDWAQSFDTDRALEHAASALEIATRIMAPTAQEPARSKGKYIEAPHDALCVFHASLVVWANMLFKGPKGPDPSSNRTKYLDQAAFSLARMRLSIAKTLAQVLIRIKTFEIPRDIEQ